MVQLLEDLEDEVSTGEYINSAGVSQVRLKPLTAVTAAYRRSFLQPLLTGFRRMPRGTKFTCL